MTSEQPIPFFDEYLLNVLKPRVQGLLDGHEAALRQRVFTGVVRAIAEQTGVEPERVERLLVDELKLEIRVSLSARFGGTPDGDHPGGIDEDSVIDVMAEPGEVPGPSADRSAEPKPKGTMKISPLAQAVAAGGRG